MILKYIIEYMSNDNAYATIIKDLADKSGLKISIVRANGAIILYIDEGEDEIKSFFTTLGESLPLSVYVGQSRVEEAASFPVHTIEFAKAELPLMSNVKELMKIVDENSGEYLNPFALLDNTAGSIEIAGKTFQKGSDIKDAVRMVATKIINGEVVSFENESGSFSISKNEPVDGLKTILCVDLNRVAPEYKVPNVALFALSSMERPFVSVSNAKEDGGSEYVRFALAGDPLLLCVAKLVGDSGIHKLFISPRGLVGDVKYSGFVSKSGIPEILIHRDRKLFLSGEKFDSAILPIEEDSLVAFFGEGQKASFLAVRPGVLSKELLSIKSFDKNTTEEVSALDENGAKLLANFESRFAGLIAKCDSIEGGYDFEKFLTLCSIVLGSEADSGLAYLVELAAKNKAPAGVKIDFILETEESKPTLNLVKSFRTLLSYKIAGVEDTVLAYSIFESFADFVTILSDEARKGFEAKELVLCGGMFYSQTLSDRVFTKARNIRVSSAYIPQILK